MTISTALLASIASMPPPGQGGAPEEPVLALDPDTLFGADLVAWHNSEGMDGYAENAKLHPWADVKNGHHAYSVWSSDYPRKQTDANGWSYAYHNGAAVGGGGSQLRWWTDNWPDWPTPLENGAEAFVLFKPDADPPTLELQSAFLCTGSGEVARITHLPYTDSKIYDGWGTTVRKDLIDKPMDLDDGALHIYHAASFPDFWELRIDDQVIHTTLVNTVGWRTPWSETCFMGGRHGGFEPQFKGAWYEFFVIKRQSTPEERASLFAWFDRYRNPRP